MPIQGIAFLITPTSFFLLYKNAASPEKPGEAADKELSYSSTVNDG